MLTSEVMFPETGSNGRKAFSAAWSDRNMLTAVRFVIFNADKYPDNVPRIICINTCIDFNSDLYGIFGDPSVPSGSNSRTMLKRRSLLELNSNVIINNAEIT